MMLYRIALAVAGAATLAACTAAPAGAATEAYDTTAAHAMAATGVILRDGNGADLGITNGAHGDLAGTGGSEAFLEVNPSGSYFELEGQTNALCLTVDTSQSDEVLWEGCGGSNATLWTRSGELYKSKVTSEPLFASPEGYCVSGSYGGLSSKGGEPENCSNEWNNA